MKIRTVYFKVSDMEKAVSFWSQFLATEPHKRSQWWSEFKCEQLNFGLLWSEGFEVKADQSNFVPVFEFRGPLIETQKDLALSLGASLVVELKKHPEFKSYVLADPSGHEFEITQFHD